MDLGLRGRKILITGASAGIGSGIARVLASEGANLVLAARSADKLEAKRAALVAEFGVAIDVAICDVSSSADIDALVERHPDIDVLVNNAGAVPGGDLFTVDEARWRAGWDTKVFAYINLCRRYYPLMQARGGGVIININGAGSFLKRFDYICGGMGNAALDFFTQTLGAHSPADNIRVVAVSPGPVGTERYRNITAARVASGAKLQALPFDRVAEPEEIGEMVAFLASDRAAYASGAVYMVDGGMSVSKQPDGG